MTSQGQQLITGGQGTFPITSGPISGPPIDLYIGPVDPRLANNNMIVNIPNAAYISCFQVFQPELISLGQFTVGTQNGNIDIGLYNNGGLNLGSAGSTACPAVGVRSLPLLNQVLLLPGYKYWSAFGADNGVVSVRGIVTLASTVELIGTSEIIAASFPLPPNLPIGTAGSARSYAIFWKP